MSYHLWPAKIDYLTTKHPIGLIVNTLSAPEYQQTVNDRFAHPTETRSDRDWQHRVARRRTCANEPLTVRTRTTTSRNSSQHERHIRNKFPIRPPQLFALFCGAGYCSCQQGRLVLHPGEAWNFARSARYVGTFSCFHPPHRAVRRSLADRRRRQFDSTTPSRVHRCFSFSELHDRPHAAGLVAPTSPLSPFATPWLRHEAHPPACSSTA